jgi:hypothetical protein
MSDMFLSRAKPAVEIFDTFVIQPPRTVHGGGKIDLHTSRMYAERPPCFTSAASRAEAIIALLGVQPKFTQEPPRCSRSNSTTG